MFLFHLFFSDACTAKNQFHFVESTNRCTAICYHVTANIVDYAGAEAACAAAGGALITLDTLKKNALMINTIRSSGEWSTACVFIISVTIITNIK